MSKSKRFSKVIVAVLVLAMILSLMPVIALASPISVTKTNTITVNSTTVEFGTTGDVTGFSDASVTSAGTSYQVGLKAGYSASTVAVTIGGTPSTSIALTNGEGSGTYTIGGSTYIFNVFTENAYPPAQNSIDYLTMPDAEVTNFHYDGQNPDTDVYEFTATTTVSGFPKTLSLRVLPDGEGYDSITTYSYNVTSSTASMDYYAGSYYTASFPTDGSTLKFTLSYTKGNTPVSNDYSITLNYSGTVSTGAGVSSYLPAPGQFANEGVTTGGWGDAYASGGTALKSFKGVYTSTGISLGSFGGYAVFDFGKTTTETEGGGTVTVNGLKNDPNNAFGVDFVVFGNALATWAEPGCIQVGVDKTGGGIEWYDIAGSQHYDNTTTWNYKATYTNPVAADDASSYNAGTTGTIYTSGVSYNYEGSYVGGIASATTNGNGTVTYNTFHRHSWFPLFSNYFAPRTDMPSGLANLTQNSGYVTYSNYNDTDNNSTLSLSGVKLGTTATTPDTYLFGYADCHINGTSPSGAQQNPYTTGRNSGGDPIDISWAVYPAGTMDGETDISGQPVYLESVRYVRVYTGVQQMNGIMGESSTEITGIFVAATTVSGGAGTTGYPTVSATAGTFGAYTELKNNILRKGTLTVSGSTTTISASSTATNVLINGSHTNSIQLSSSNGTTQYVQIITQNGNAQGSITVLKVVFQ